MFPDYHGKIGGFGGLLRGKKYIERPFGMADYLDVTRPDDLPFWAPTWWRMSHLVPPDRGGADPFILYDNRTGTILHVWEQENPPAYVDVLQVCTQLLDKQRSRQEEKGK